MANRKDLKIFIASSGELKTEREECILIIAELNKLYPHLHLEAILYELDISSGSNPGYERIQDRINPLLDKSEIVVVLFHSKVGEFTNEEFERARQQNKKIFIYLKNGFVPTTAKDATNLAKVLSLKEVIEKESNIRYESFEKLTEFNGKLFKDLQKYVLESHSKFSEKSGQIIPKLLTERPFDTDLFLGRTAEITKVELLLKTKKNKVVILSGQGGLGKTTLASQYWIKFEHKYKHLIWLFNDDGIEKILTTLAFILDINVYKGNPAVESTAISQKELLNQIIVKLSNLDKPCLLIIDNANQPKDNWKLLNQLNNFHIIVTSRLTKVLNFEIYRIPPLSEPDCIELFTNYYNEVEANNRDLLLKIFTSVNRNTLVIELLAKTLRQKNKFRRTYPISALLRDLQEKGLMLIPDAKIDTEYQNFQSVTPIEIIRAMYDLHSLSEAENRVLNYFAVLPSESISYETLLTILTPENLDEFDDSLDQLSLKGWIDFDIIQKNFKISNVIQQVVVDVNKETILNSNDKLIKNLISLINNIDTQDDFYPNIASSIVTFFEVSNLDLGILAYYLSYYYHSYNDNFRAERLISAIEKFLTINNNRETAFLNQHVTMLYAYVLESFDKYAEAGEYYNKARNLATELGIEFDEIRYALYKSKIGRFAEGEPVLYHHYCIKKQQFNLNKNNKDVGSHLALSAHNLAKILYDQGRFDEAIIFHNEAVGLYEEFYGLDHEYAGITKLHLATTLVAFGKADSAFNNIFESINDIYHKTYNVGDFNFAYLHFLFFDIFIASNDIQSATISFNKGVEILTKYKGRYCKKNIESFIKLAVLGWNLAQENNIEQKLYNSVIEQFTSLFDNEFTIIVNRFSIYSPILHKGLELMVKICNEKGETEKHKRYQNRLDEFLRICRIRGSINLTNPVVQSFKKGERTKLIKLFKSVASLPIDSKKITLTCYLLLFYNTFKLFELEYKNTSQNVIRYILSDGKECYAIDYTNNPIHDIINKKPSQLNLKYAKDYIKFFFDSVCGSYGFFFIIRDDRPLPWRLDVEINEEVVNLISRNIKNLEFENENGNEIRFKAYMIFKNALFFAEIAVDKRDDGRCSMINDRQVFFKKNGECLYLFTDHRIETPILYDVNGLEYKPVDGEELISEIPACVDHSYT